MSMVVYHNSAEIPAELKGSVMTLGNFDGLHLGHRALVGRTVEWAHSLKAPSLVLSFEPHPMKVLHPEKGFRELFPLEDLKEQLSQIGVSALLVLKFDVSLASLSPSDFLTNIVLKDVQPKAVVIGYDFRFGQGRSGTYDVMSSVLTEYGVPVEQVKPLKINGKIVSSSAIRQLLGNGEVKEAEIMLGRPFELRGKIGSGEKRGRRIGFPTANLDFENEIVPRVGVYLTEFVVDQEVYASLTNVGYRPTFDQDKDLQRLTVETFLIDANVDVYDKFVKVRFLEWLRGERVFPNASALSAQIQDDLSAARKFFAGRNV